MAESALQERLRGHAEAFDGLLSLIPAKYYYGEDTSDQWKKKKQTKEQAAAARRAKLDPESAKSAKDVMDERARKRKLEQVEDAEISDIEGIEKEQPKQGLKLAQEKKAKKQKTAKDSEQPSADGTKPEAPESIGEERRLKQEKKKEKKEKKLQKQAEKKQQKDAQKVELPAEEAIEEQSDQQSEPHAKETVEAEDTEGDMDAFEADGLEEEKVDDEGNSQQSAPPSPTFDQPSPADPAEPSANTSTSSTIPPAQKPKHIKLPSDPELLRSRLAARIEALRAARKADGPDGQPARNRAELMEARRKKEEQRKAHKKELRLKAKLEEEARREAALASARDSPASSLMSPAVHSPEHNFSFGRVSFADGQNLSSDLTRLQSTPRKRGPQDAASALAANEKKAARIAGLDAEKRADIEEKDLWLNAKKKAHGEKVRDDTNLLKKTLKRKEKMKSKSQKEWGDRKEGVAKSIAMKQKKREENLRKRKEGSAGKGKGKKVGAGKKSKSKGRPGFEGSFGGKRK